MSLPENTSKDDTVPVSLDDAMMLTEVLYITWNFVMQTHNVTSKGHLEPSGRHSFGIYNIVHMLLTGVILMGVIVQNLVLGYALPAGQCDLDLTLPERGWIAAIPFVAIIFTLYLWGWLADTRGRRSVMLVSMIMSIIFTVLLSFAPTVASFVTLAFLSAVFMSGSSAVVYTFLGEFTNSQHRDKIVAFGSSFVGIGSFLLPGLAWLILPLEFSIPISFLGIKYRSWRLLILLSSLPFVIGTVFLCFSPESPKFLFSARKEEACLEVLKSIYSVNKRKSKMSYPVKSLISEFSESDTSKKKGIAAIWSSIQDQTVPLFKLPLLPWTCLACFVQFGILATNNGFYLWFPTILNSLANHDGSQSRVCDILVTRKSTDFNSTVVTTCDDTINSATFELSIYVGLIFYSMYIIVVFLVSFVSKKSILVVIPIITGLCGIVAPLVYDQQVAIGLFAVFQMCGACIGLMNAVSVELFPTKHRAMAICLSMMMGRVGSMMGSNLIGAFLETQCETSFYIFGGLVIGCGLLCLTLPGNKKRSESKTDLKDSSEDICAESR